MQEGVHNELPDKISGRVDEHLLGRRALHTYRFSRTARSAASKPIFECVPSQKGFVVDPPQRQRAIASPSGRSYSLPSASISVIGPVTLYGPLWRTLMITSLMPPILAPSATRSPARP